MAGVEIEIGRRKIGDGHPTYFLADIASNHDGDLERAIALVHLAAGSGADGAKFQHFAAETIVSDQGFRALGGPASHQASWTGSVYDVYKAAEVGRHWTAALRDACDEAGIDFVTTPYSLELLDALVPHVAAIKIGSGDITWPTLIRAVAAKGLPTLLATGASELSEVVDAVRWVRESNDRLVLMQCNTNYTGSSENFAHVDLNVLRAYAVLFPELVLGLSDHTPGHAAALGAIALGARVIEKHFTDDGRRKGPDHGFSMTPDAWSDMVARARELEAALGSSLKAVAENERETVILQRRCIRATRDLETGTVLDEGSLSVLRPCPPDGLPPCRLPEVLGRVLARDLDAGECVRWTDLA